jgi:hypothetical protein
MAHPVVRSEDGRAALAINGEEGTLPPSDSPDIDLVPDPPKRGDSMRKEFESGLARRVAERKPEKRTVGKAWIALVLCAAIFAVSAASVAAMQAMNGEGQGDLLTDREQLKDGSCEETLTDSDGICDCTCDCADDCVCDCPDCPCYDGTA